MNIPASVADLQEKGQIKLLVHPKNLGPSAARNTGIRAGTGKWILLLDDDIRPEKDLLFQYAGAIQKNETALGFVGLTVFPKPFNAVTKAMETGGWISHFTGAEKKLLLRWAPTSNILLNRVKMDSELFDETLTKSGEDIDFLVRGSLNRNEQYIALPEAVVRHPWWNNGAIQTKRLLRYGAGASEIARKPPIRDFTFRDFTNTSETLLLFILLIPFALIWNFTHLLLIIFCSVVLAEFLTCWLRAILIGKTFSPWVAFHILWAKNAYETGYLIRSLQTGFLNGFALRTDMGFHKAHPGSFRTNRWKILKLILITVMFLVAVIAF